MPGGNVYKDHTFNKETAQYIAWIFTVQCKYMNIDSTVQVHEHYKTQETQKIHEENTESTKKKFSEGIRSYL
jgi:hypothetical protein